MRFESLNVRIHSRRTFLRRGSAAVTGLMLGSCQSGSPSAAVPSKELDPISTNEEFYAVWYRGAPVDIQLDEWRLSIQRRGIPIGELDWSSFSSMTPESIELTLMHRKSTWFGTDEQCHLVRAAVGFDFGRGRH